jgi:hypothetical protein
MHLFVWSKYTMKVLMLVISSNNYEQYKQVWRTYMKSHPQIECYFIEFSPLVFVPTLTRDTLYFRGTETYTNIIRKTILALEYFLSKSVYDYVIRTNLSSVWILSKTVSFLHTLPRTGHYGGMVLTHEKVPFVSGTCITLSYDVARTLLQHKNIAYTNNVMDDVDIGVALYHAGIHPVPSISRIDIHSEEDMHKDGFHYRVRFLTRREREPPIMLSLAARNHSSQ